MKILIGGDISVRASQELFANKKTKELFNDVLNVTKQADEFIANLECAVTDKDTKIKKFGPNLKAPYGTCEVLKEAGVTLCAISNNHIFDYGKAGIKDTFEQLDKNGLPYTGFGENYEDSRKNYYINRDGKKIAIVNVCEHEYTYALKDRMGARPYDPYDTMEDIEEAKKNADFVIVIYHGGKEHVRHPSPRLFKLCRAMIKHGANVVLCQHSHCIGCEEYYKGGYILYGQGNFHFVYDEDEKDEMWNTGLLIQINLTDEGFTIDRIPIVIDGLGIKLADKELKERLIAELEERSKSLEDGTFEEKFHEQILPMDQYYFIPQDCQDKFAHYLDCEAHEDAWRTLFPTWNQTNEKD